MHILLNKMLPMILSLALSEFIYIKIDKKYGVTDKISLKLKMHQKWKPCFCVCSMFVFILLLGLLGMPTIVYFILCGILSGLGISISTKIPIKENI